MPKISSIKTQTVSPTSAIPFQGGANDPGSFGANRGFGGSALGTAADDLAEVFLARELKDAENDAKSLDIEFAKRTRALLYGPDGYYSKKSNDAVGALTAARDAIEKARVETLGKAKSDRAAEAFDLSSQSRAEAAYISLDRYADEQRDVASAELSEARANEAVDNVVESRGDPHIVRQSLAIIEGEVAEQARIKGWDKEVVAHKMEAARTAMFDTVVKSLVTAKDSEMLQKFIDKWGDQVDPVALAAAKANAEAVVSEGYVQEKADSIMARNLSDTKAMEEARKEKDPFRRTKLEAMVSQRLNEREVFKNRALTTRAVNIADSIVAGGGSITEMLDKARKTIGDGRLEIAVIDQIKIRYNEAQAAAKVQYDANDVIITSELSKGARIEDILAANPEARITSEDFRRYKLIQKNVSEGREYSENTDTVGFTKLMSLSDSELDKVPDEVIENSKIFRSNSSLRISS